VSIARALLFLVCRVVDTKKNQNVAVDLARIKKTREKS
jgi:hypothetical protein